MKPKYFLTKQQHANLIEARDVMWPSVPPENVSKRLSLWKEPDHYSLVGKSRKKYDCNTIACFGGWCAAWPNFKAQGLKMGDYYRPIFNGVGSAFDGARALFGDYYLFAERGNHIADSRVAMYKTDHEIVKERLNYILNNCVVEC